MPEISKGLNFFDSRKRKAQGRSYNEPAKKSRSAFQGRVFKNHFLDTDLTSQIATRRKLKGN